jgi:hypothetical protein
MSISVKLIDEATHRLLAEIQCGRSLGRAIAEAAEAHPGSDLVDALATVISSAALAAPATEGDTV